MTRPLLKRFLSPFIVFSFIHAYGLSQTGSLTVDHRYSIPWWQSVISLPDDPVKTLVGKEGQLFGDFGYDGGPRRFSFSVLFDEKDSAAWKSQQLHSNSSPMLETLKESNGITIQEDIFQEIPSPEKVYSIVRFDSRKSLPGWSKPSVACDPAFNDAALGSGASSGEGLAEFHIKVPAGAAYTVALGFCEGKWEEPGHRVMRVFVEGDTQKDIDPVKDFGPRKPGVYLFRTKDLNRDSIITIAISNAPGAEDRDAIVNGLWMFRGNVPSTQDIVSGKANASAVIYARCADVRMPERKYHLLVRLKNTTGSPVSFDPILRYTGLDELTKQDQNIRLDRFTQLSSSIGIRSLTRDSVNHYSIYLPAIPLNAGESKQITIVLHRFPPAGGTDNPTVSNTLKEMQRSEAWWQKNSPSSSAISIPDTGIQSMVNSSVRNIFQARDDWKGNKTFHVGPTKYRGLWLADGTFLLEVGTMLGYVKDVRSCIDYLTGLQLKDGGFAILGDKFYKENGLVPFLVIRHAMLTQDKEWLRANWSVIEGCIKMINRLRAEALKDSSKPYFGLLPPGAGDGGIPYGNEYTNTVWCLAGMNWAIKAAKWLGKKERAASLEADYKNWFGFFAEKAGKDLRKDEYGNTYLPVMINNEKNYEPQRGQWAFCHSVYPGQIYDSDPAASRWAAETIDMMTAHRKEGLVVTAGWMTNGLWTYFSSFYGHAMQWLGKTEGLPQLLYDFANHSSPTLVWREEQKPQGEGYAEVGDMPHNWASAEFIRMVVHMIEIDRGNDLHLFEALPKQWAGAGKTTRLNGIRTPFGRINLSLSVNDKGDTATLDLAFMDKGNLPGKIVIHEKSWTGNDVSRTVKGAQSLRLTIDLK